MSLIGLSFDIEDWFCVQNMKEIFPFKNWNKCESRVYESTQFILRTLKQNDIKATFFILAWIAERIPELVYDILREGHEIASHGYSHTLITNMSKREFQKDTNKSLRILSGITGKMIKGYRAPSFSITRETMWALEILRDCGIQYDSSIYPIKHPDYGIIGFPEEIHEIEGITEVPLTTSRFFGLNLPISGGGYFRLYPYDFFKMMLKKRLTGAPPIAYFHPWEFDPEQPKVALPFLKKFRHYVGLEKNREKFERFLKDFQFTTLEYLVKNKKEFIEQGTDRFSFTQEVAS